jgi:hypothetical protein
LQKNFKDAVFAKIAVFTKIVFLQKSAFFAKIGIFAKKVQQQKFFGESDFWERARGISKNPIRLSQKSCFSTQNPIFAKKILQTLLQCPPLHPRGVGGSNPVF